MSGYFFCQLKNVEHLQLSFKKEAIKIEVELIKIALNQEETVHKGLKEVVRETIKETNFMLILFSLNSI